MVKKLDIEEEVTQMVSEAPFSTLIKLVNDVEFRSSSANMKLLFNFIADLMKSFSDDLRDRRSSKGYLIDKSTIAHLSDSISLKAIDDELLKRIATFIYEVCKNPVNFKHVLHEVKSKVISLYSTLGHKYSQLNLGVPRSVSKGVEGETASPLSKLSDGKTPEKQSDEKEEQKVAAEPVPKASSRMEEEMIVTRVYEDVSSNASPAEKLPPLRTEDEEERAATYFNDEEVLLRTLNLLKMLNQKYEMLGSNFSEANREEKRSLEGRKEIEGPKEE